MAESTPPAPGRIFISYRRTEADYPASWLYERLGAMVTAARAGGQSIPELWPLGTEARR